MDSPQVTPKAGTRHVLSLMAEEHADHGDPRASGFDHWCMASAVGIPCTPGLGCHSTDREECHPDCACLKAPRCPWCARNARRGWPDG